MQRIYRIANWSDVLNQTYALLLVLVNWRLRMSKSSKLIALSETYKGIDCNQLVKLCTKEAETVLFSECGHEYEFKFDDGSAVSFFKATITEWHCGKAVFEKTDFSFLQNYNLPFEGDYNEFGKLIGD